MIKKKKYLENPFYLKLKDSIIKNNNKIFIPNDKILNNSINFNNSCFEIIKKSTINDNKNIILNEKFNNFVENKIEYVSEKIILKLNSLQKNILKVWFKANDLMYNETIKFLKENIITFQEEFDNNENIQKFILLTIEKKNMEFKFTSNKKIINKKNISEEEIFKTKIIILHTELKLKFLKKELKFLKDNINLFLKNKPYSICYNNFKINYQNIRTYFLKEKRNEIINNCNSRIINKDIKIKTHILDSTIKLACSNYQSALTNFKNGNIKKFRVRYWKEKREKKVLEIEDCYFSKNSLCYSIFGLIKGYLKKGKKFMPFNFDSIKGSVKLHYNKKTDEYLIYTSKRCKDNFVNKNNNIISIDPGLRTFLTCLSNNEILEIGNLSESKLEKLINLKIKINNLKKDDKFLNNKKIRKLKVKINKRIKGFVDELHWKSAKYLTDNYKKILIGDLSTKGIVSNDNSLIGKINKQKAYSLSFYKFRQRLEYKCKLKNCNYIVVSEYYTSKTCSICGNYKEDLGSNKVYNCLNCKSSLDRDVNACRNILFKCM